jgi:hypothetical protein
MFKEAIADLLGRGWTLQRIADACGFASRGHVHDVLNGKQISVSWEIGDKLLRLHKRVMRRKVSA